MKSKYSEPDIPTNRSSKRQRASTPRPKTITQLAQKLRTIYITHRRAWEERVRGKPSTYLPGPFWDGGVTGTGCKRQNVWKKLAEFVLEHDLDPYDYVRAQFFLAGLAYPPQPNQLLAQQALANYRENLSKEEEVLISRALKAQQEHLLEAVHDWQWDNAEGFTREQIQLAILLDEDLSLSALFRFCIAIDEKLDAVAERYLLAAVLQYLSHSDTCDKVWGGWIPEWFRSAARKHREELINKGIC